MERERSKPSPPKCPECESDRVDSLSSDDLYSRYQCGNSKCLHSWSVKRDGFASALAKAREKRRAPSEEEVVQMGRAKLLCEKGCGREFVHPKRKANHEEDCTGEKPAKRASAGRKSPPPGPTAVPAAPAGAAATTGMILLVSTVPAHLAGTPLGEALQLFIRRRDELSRELSGVNHAIEIVLRQASPAAQEGVKSA